MRDYITAYNIRGVARKKPLTNVMINGMLACPQGAKRGDLELGSWNDYYWIAVAAWISLLAESGERKDEFTRKSLTAEYPMTKLTFSSLCWLIGGKEIPCPTKVVLNDMSESRGDGIYVAHGTAKNDQLGLFFAPTPSTSFFPFSKTATRNGARALRTLEFAAMDASAATFDRARTPLVGPTRGVAFTAHEVDAMFILLLTCGAGVLEGMIDDYSIHSFRIFVASALMKAGASRFDIERLVRWRGDESLEIYARLNNDEWSKHVFSTYTVEVDSTIAMRLASYGPLDLDQVAVRVTADGGD